MGYLSGFSRSIDQKLEAVWSYTFSSRRNGPLGEPRDRCGKAAGGCLAEIFFRGTFPKAGAAFRRGLTQSRRLSGAVLFRVIAAGRLGCLTIGVERQPEVVWPERLFGVNLRRLERFFAQYRSKVEGCLAGIFFRGTFPKAGVAFRRGSPQSWRQPGLNVFSEHNSEGWWDFSQGIDQKPKAVWSCTFSGYRSGPLREPHDRWEKAAGSGRALKLF